MINQKSNHCKIDSKTFNAKTNASENATKDINHKSEINEIKNISKKSFKSNQIETIKFADDSCIDSILKRTLSFSAITKLHLPASIQKLEEGWCSQTPYLNYVTISPKNVNFQIYNNQLLIGRNDKKDSSNDTIYFAFRNIKSTTIPSFIKVIKSYSFEFCQKITNVLFMDDSKLTKIEKFSFSNSSIQSISIPKLITDINHDAFYNCENIKSFELDDKLEIKACDNIEFKTNDMSYFFNHLILYKSMINQISNKDIKRLYSKFSFIYCKFDENQDNLNHNLNSILNYLIKLKFITCYTKNDFNISSKSNCIFCVEGKCIIIEKINTDSIDKLINELESKQQLVLIKLNQKDIDQDINEEIQSFCKKYEYVINNNSFVKYTIQSIVGYIIRRNYYPSHYFKDSSFFNYDATKNEFNENEFIILRNIYSNNNTYYYLIINIDTFHLFVEKIYNESKMKHEIKFCAYSNPLFTRFYGFVKKGKEIIGLIYKFMSNGSLYSYKKPDDMYSMMTIIRISNGIEYLHENGLIHRDIKPGNVLIDNNGIPYISDFETIRTSDSSEGEFTNDIGSVLFASPEQDKGENISYPTDIYSLGLIIYYLYENDDISSIKEQFKPMFKGPKIIRYLYEKCAQYKIEDRIKIDEFNKIIMSKYLLFCSFYEQYLLTNDKQDYLKAKEIYEKSTNNIDPEIFNALGDFYKNGYDVKEDFLIAAKYYEKSAKRNDSYSFNKLKDLYNKGYKIKKDYLKAKEYYELSAKNNNSEAFYLLGYLYFNGYGVKKSFETAEKYFEKSAKLQNSHGFNALGYLNVAKNGREEDCIKAKKCYEEGIKLGNLNSYLNLAYLYIEGIGVVKDPKKAFELYEKAAAKNHDRALHQIGKMYKNGLGVEKDLNKAREYFEKALMFGNREAAYSLGNLYFYGKGVEKNYKIARDYYLISSEHLIRNSLNKLGIIYENGLGVKKNLHIAKEYYELACENGYYSALIKLAYFYQNGEFFKFSVLIL